METLMKVVFAENPIYTAYPYEKRLSEFVKKLTVMLPVYHSGSYHAAAVVGEHGTEGVSCAPGTENGYFGADYRSSTYYVNNWEYCVLPFGRYYTYFFTLPDG